MLKLHTTLGYICSILLTNQSSDKSEREGGWERPISGVTPSQHTFQNVHFIFQKGHFWWLGFGFKLGGCNCLVDPSC